jgi:glycosyltransferase involved in cell wall biosynthesis
LKVAGYRDAAARPYLLQDWEHKVARLREKGHRVVSCKGFCTEEELANLYRSVDVLCQPSRGEGFPTPLLEAMACGTPVITTSWSGGLDFVKPGCGILLREYQLVDGRGRMYDYPSDAGPTWLAEPDENELASALRRVEERRNLLASWSGSCVELASRWSWDRCAESLRDALDAIEG